MESRQIGKATRTNTTSPMNGISHCIYSYLLNFITYIPGIYLTVVMAMSALSVVLSVFVLNIHHRGGMIRKPPNWVKRVANRMSKVFCMNVNLIPDPKKIQTQSYVVKQLHGHGDHDTLLNMHNSNGEMTDSHDTLHEKFVDTSESKSPQHGTNRTPKRIKLEKEILDYFNYVMSSNDQAMIEKQTIYEWQEVARVIDKFFFWLFVSISSTMTVFLLIISPMTKHISIEV